MSSFQVEESTIQWGRVCVRLTLYVVAGALVRHVVLWLWPDAPPQVALAAAGGVTVALTSRWLYKIRNQPDKYWQLLPVHWEVAFQLLQGVFDRFVSEVASRPSQHPTMLNLYALSLIHEEHSAIESARRSQLLPHSPDLPTTSEFAAELRLFSQFAVCAYGFYLAGALRSPEAPMPLQELLARKTGIDESDLLFFNHSVVAALQTAPKKPRSGELDGGVPRYLVALHRPSKSIVLAIRGSVALSDWAIDLICDNVPFLTGFAHGGIVWAAKELLIDAAPHLQDAMRQHPECDRLVITGHSLGGGVATIISLLLLANLASSPLKLTDEQRGKLLCVAAAPPPVVGPPHAVATMCGGINLDSHIFTIVNREDVVPRISFRSVARLSRQIDIIDSLPLTTSERFEIMRNGGSAAIRAVLTRETRAALSFAPLGDEQADKELVLSGKIFYKDAAGNWRVPPPAAFQHIILSTRMVLDHFPHEYVSMFDPPASEAEATAAERTEAEAKQPNTNAEIKLKHT